MPPIFVGLVILSNMPIKTLAQGNLNWINIDHLDSEMLSYLKTQYGFHPLDLEDLQSEQQIPKLDAYQNYLFIILQFPHWQGETNMIVAQELAIFLGDNYLITIQQNKSKELKNFFYRCLNNRKVKADWMSGSSGYLLYRLIEELFENTRPILNNIGKQISVVESAIFSGEQDTGIIKRLGGHRRNILLFRRILEPQRYLVSTLSHTRKSFLDEHMSLYFDNVHDSLNNMWAIVETFKETVDGLHVTVESLINRRINKLITVLTAFSVSLLPLNLLAGIYGMNIALPFQNQPNVIWIMFVVLTSLIILLIYALKRHKWL